MESNSAKSDFIHPSPHAPASPPFQPPTDEGTSVQPLHGAYTWKPQSRILSRTIKLTVNPSWTNLSENSLSGCSSHPVFSKLSSSTNHDMGAPTSKQQIEDEQQIEDDHKACCTTFGQIVVMPI